MPITSNTYDARSGEMIFGISAAEGSEEFKLAVTPTGRDRSQLTFWQGDRYDANSFLVAQSDPLRLDYEDDRENLYRIVETVFDPRRVKRWRSSRAIYASGVRRRAKGGGTSSAH